MSTVTVRVTRNGVHHIFLIDPPSPADGFPEFDDLCEQLVENLALPTTASILADSSRTPFHILTKNEDGTHSRIFDDLSLRGALRLGKPFRLDLRVARRRSCNLPNKNHSHGEDEALLEEVLAAEVRPDDDHQGHCDPPVHVFSPTSLLNLLTKLREEESGSVSSAIDAVERCIKCHTGDARALRRRRHELAGLFSVFLAQAALPGPGCIPKRLGAPFIEKLHVAMQTAGVSKHTTSAALRAVKTICNCRPAVATLRTLYADAACEAASRKAGSEEANVLVNAAVTEPSKNTVVMPATERASESAPQSRLDSRPVKHYLNHFRQMRRAGGPEVKEAYLRFEHARSRVGDMFPFELSRRLCRSLQRSAFHFLRCHVSAPDYEFEQNAVRALATSVVRKLLRVGYDRRLVDVTIDLVTTMATDKGVIRVACGWANAEMADAPIDEVNAGADDPDDSGELEAMAEAAEEEMLMNASRKSHSSAGSRPGSRPGSVHEGGGEGGSNDSLDSVDSLEEEQVMAQFVKSRMNQFSPVHSSEELGANGEGGNGSDGSSTSTTNRSEWARVEREREREEQLRKARQLDREREMQLARERQLDIDLARERQREEEIEREVERMSRGSRGRSRASSRSRTSRGPGGSERPRSIRSSHRSVSERAREIREDMSRAGSAYMNDVAKSLSLGSGSLRRGDGESVPGSERRSIQSVRSGGRNRGSGGKSVGRSRMGSRSRDSIISSVRGSVRH